MLWEKIKKGGETCKQTLLSGKYGQRTLWRAFLVILGTDKLGAGHGDSNSAESTSHVYPQGHAWWSGPHTSNTDTPHTLHTGRMFGWMVCPCGLVASGKCGWDLFPFVPQQLARGGCQGVWVKVGWRRGWRDGALGKLPTTQAQGLEFGYPVELHFLDT